MRRARAAIRLAERLAAMKDDVESVDSLSALAPAESTQRERLAARDALDLPAKADDLARALDETRASRSIASRARSPR
ncbi:MAG: hypothetical protein V9F03_05305 [Microthrixaceae bacterium]